MRPTELRHLVRSSRDIQGWLSPAGAALFALLDEAQREADTRGGLFEIGVHHGRSAVLLCAMAGADEQVGVCDLFADQSGNVSQSGLGDRAIFESNLQRVVPDFDRLTVFAKRSSELSPGEISQPQRLFHVDGGHLHDEALSDIRLAAHTLHPGGAIVIDDPFRPEWPGVTEAFLAFLGEERDFVPLILGFNKLVLVRRDARLAYESMLARPGTLWSYFDRQVFETKTLPLAGEPLRIMLIPPWRQRPALELSVARLLSHRSAALDLWRRGMAFAARPRSR